MDKHKKAILISQLMTLKIKGTISEEEEILLQNLIRQLKINPDFEDSLNLDDIYNQIELSESFDKKKVWSNISKTSFNSPKNKLKPFLFYAASIIIVFGVAFSLYKFRQREEVPVERLMTKNIILETSSGEIVLLDNHSENSEKIKKLGLNINDNNLIYTTTNDSITKIEYHKIIVPRGAEYNLTLSDGTDVWLFPETELYYPNYFAGNDREIFIKGEAYFEVAKDSLKPFIVKTAHLNIAVLGTSFNIKAYDEKNTDEVSLVSGSVKVNDYILIPNTKAIYDITDGSITVEEIDGEIFSMRKNGYFIFNKEPLRNIVEELSRWYDFDYSFVDEKISEKSFGFKLPRYEDFNELIKILELTGEMKFRHEKNKVKIYENR